MKDKAENKVIKHQKIVEGNETKHVITFEDIVLPSDSEIMNHSFIKGLIGDKMHYFKSSTDLHTVRLSVYE